METVGRVTEARDEEKGLWIHAEFFSDEAAQTARSRILEARDGGAEELYRLSVGYIPTKWAEFEDEEGKYGVEYFEARLLEATITVLPANRDAVITAAKSVCDAARPDIDVAVLRGAIDRFIELTRGKAAQDPPALDATGELPDATTRRHSNRSAVLRRRLALTLIG